MPPPNTITVQQDFPARLQVQRAKEELALAQKKLKEYEDLFAKLYYNSCGHCKAKFQRIAGANAVSEFSTASSVAVSAGNTPRASSSSIEPLWYRMLSGFIFSRHGPATSRVSGGSSPDDVCHMEQIQPFVGSSNPKLSTSPSEDKPLQAQYFSRFTAGKPTLQVKLERVWTQASVYSVKFSPDGKYLAVAVSGELDEQATCIYDVEDGRKISLLTDRDTKRYRFTFARYLSFSPGEGKYLATGQPTGQTLIWEVGKKRIRNAFRARSWHTLSVDFSPDARFVVSNSLNRSDVRIWSMRDGSSISLKDPHWEGPSFNTDAVKFTPDGKHVASYAGDMLRLWNVRTSNLVRRWEGHQFMGRCMAFTPNGRGLVTAGYENTFKYWNLGQPGFDHINQVDVLTFVGHTKGIRSVAVSPDGRWVVSGSDDGTARIWDISDASSQCTLLGHQDVVSCVDFCPTGNYVACGSWDGTVSMWKYES